MGVCDSVSEGVSVQRLSLNMQLRAGGDIVCVGPPVGAVRCNPGQDRIARSANLLSLMWVPPS